LSCRSLTFASRPLQSNPIHSTPLQSNLTTGDLQASEYEFFRGTFDYLKRNNANVNISAGRTECVGLQCFFLPSGRELRG